MTPTGRFDPMITAVLAEVRATIGRVSTLHLIPPELSSRFDVWEWRNATAILQAAYPTEWADIVAVLTDFELRRSEVESAGGSKSPIAKRLDEPLAHRGWIEHGFDTKILVDGRAYDAPTHKVDCFKGGVALEVEWNNKDPFFDRDLNNFRLLFELRAIGVGVIVTRSSELQQVFDDLGKGKSYGNSTTHLGKLIPKVDGGGGGGCPVLAFGITRACFVDDLDGAHAQPGTVF